MANVDATKLIQFYTGTALPSVEKRNDNYVYFIQNSGKGQLYKGSVLIAETNDNEAIATINAAIEKINSDLATKATKDDLAAHVRLYESLLELVNGTVTRVTAAEGKITANEGNIASNTAAIQTNAGNIASNLGEINQLKTRMTTAEGAIDAIEADYLKAADKTELSTAIGAEKSRAESAEAGLDARIDDLEAKTEGINSNVSTAISEAVNVEKERAEGVEAGLAERIEAIEDDYLTEADKTELSSKIEADVKAEADRAKGVEQGLDGRLTTAEEDIVELQGQVGTLGNALHFRGAGEFENRPTENLKAGDVYVVVDPEHENDGKEYVYTGSEWIEFGDVSDYATKVELLAEETRAKAAEQKLTDDLAAEVLRATGAESANTEAIAAEKTRAEKAEKDLKDAADLLKSRVDAFDHILDEEGSVTQAIAAMEVTLKQYADQAEADAVAAAKEYTDGEIDKVEEAIAGLENDKAEKTDLADLAARVTALDAESTGRVAVLEGEMDAVEQRVTTLEGDLNTAETGLKARMTAAEDAIDTNAANIDINKVDIAALYNALQWHQVV